MVKRKYKTRTIYNKLVILREALNSENYSSIARKYTISRQNIYYWKQKSEKMVNCKYKQIRRNTYNERTKNKEKENMFIKEIKNMRNLGLVVTKDKLYKLFIEIYPERIRKSVDTNSSYINFLRRKYSIVARRITTYSSDETIEKANEIKNSFINRVKLVLKQKKIDYTNIMNLDETNLVLGGINKSTLEFRGAKTVEIRCKEPKKSMTVALTVKSNGEILNPLSIFKGNNFHHSRNTQ